MMQPENTFVPPVRVKGGFVVLCSSVVHQQVYTFSQPNSLHTLCKPLTQLLYRDSESLLKAALSVPTYSHQL